MKMDCQVSLLGATACLMVRGAVHEEEAEQLKRHFNSLPLCQVREVVLDLGELTYIGSSGIGKLLLLYKALARCEGTLRLVRTPLTIAELLKAMRLHELFEINADLNRQGEHFASPTRVGAGRTSSPGSVPGGIRHETAFAGA